MSWTQVSCQYDGSYPGFLSCVFDCYVNREEPVEFRTPDGFDFGTGSPDTDLAMLRLRNPVAALPERLTCHYRK